MGISPPNPSDPSAPESKEQPEATMPGTTHRPGDKITISARDYAFGWAQSIGVCFFCAYLTGPGGGIKSSGRDSERICQSCGNATVVDLQQARREGWLVLIDEAQ